MSPAALRQRVGARGTGLALLLEPTSSPLISSALASLQTLYPDMSVYYYAPLISDASSTALTADGLIPQYDIGAADVILSVGSDFLAAGPFHLRYARQFSDRRRTPLTGMNRLYVAETGFSVTGATADHRLRCRPAEMEALLEALLDTLAARSTGGTAIPGKSGTSFSSSPWLTAVAADLRAHGGNSLVIAGERLAPRVHALVAACNDALGSTGRTVRYTRSPLLGAGRANTNMSTLADALRGGGIDTLVCIGGNPSYATPASLGFAAMLKRVPNSAYIGLYENETARDARWFVPAAHYLETGATPVPTTARTRSCSRSCSRCTVDKSAVEVSSALAGSAVHRSARALERILRGMPASRQTKRVAAALRRGCRAWLASPHA